MKQRQTRQPAYDTTARNQKELQRYKGLNRREIETLILWWVERRRCGNDALVTEILALLQLALAEKIGKNTKQK